MAKMWDNCGGNSNGAGVFTIYCSKNRITTFDICPIRAFFLLLFFFYCVIDNFKRIVDFCLLGDFYDEISWNKHRKAIYLNLVCLARFVFRYLIIDWLTYTQIVWLMYTFNIININRDIVNRNKRIQWYYRHFTGKQTDYILVTNNNRGVRKYTLNT